jgi:hypothetical protein
MMQCRNIPLGEARTRIAAIAISSFEPDAPRSV